MLLKEGGLDKGARGFSRGDPGDGIARGRDAQV